MNTTVVNYLQKHYDELSRVAARCCRRAGIPAEAGDVLHEVLLVTLLDPGKQLDYAERVETDPELLLHYLKRIIKLNACSSRAPYRQERDRLEALLDRAHITANKNTIPFETTSPFITSGVRIGTPSITARGMKETEAVQIADLVTEIIENSQLSDGAKRRALAIFTALAAAEAKAHGKTPETVMFHEVGAVDSIVDVCSVAICLDDLGIEDIVVESLSEGHGTIHCAHGLMPIPVPAVVNLCQAGNIALTPAPVAGELVTPTGAAIVAALRTSEHLPARYRIEAVGYGAGKRPYEGCSGTLRCLLVHVDA